MKLRAKLILGSDPQTAYPIEAESTLIGRASGCDVRLRDPYVSRRQAELVHDGAGFVLRNLGRNKILVNGTETEGCRLSHRDHLVLGKTELIFELEGGAVGEPDPSLLPDSEPGDDTVLMAQPILDEELGPGLIITLPDGRVRNHRLTKAVTTVGRSDEADISLVDPVVSREQCLIERRRDGYYVVHRSGTNPTLVNERAIDEKRLVSGDLLKVGTHLLSFFSDRPEDIRPVAEKIVRKSTMPVRVFLAAAVVLILGFTAYLATTKIYFPWKWRQEIQRASDDIESGAVERAETILTALLKKPLPADLAGHAERLLAEVTVMLAQNLTDQGEPARAKRLLADYLKTYGGGDASAIAWDQLNSTRMRVAAQLEGEGRYLEAIREYSSIWEDSAVYPDAQNAISRLWLEVQQRKTGQAKADTTAEAQAGQPVLLSAGQDQPEPAEDRQPTAATIDRLLAEADRHFQAKHYLTPMNANAYVIYREVLSLDADNAVAQARIRDMLTFYRTVGEKYAASGNYSKASTYFERYLLIEPDDAAIKKRLAFCRARRREDRNKAKAAPTTSRPASKQPAVSASEQQAQQQKVKRLLEESGADSSWVMQYLFGKEGEKADSDTPW